MERESVITTRARVQPGPVVALRAAMAAGIGGGAFVLFGPGLAFAAVLVALAAGIALARLGHDNGKADMAAELAETQHRLEELALRDPLTGHALALEYELSDEGEDESAAGGLTAEELIERLKQEYGATEVFEDAPGQEG